MFNYSVDAACDLFVTAAPKCIVKEVAGSIKTVISSTGQGLLFQYFWQ
jgi:hypothetical protein